MPRREDLERLMDETTEYINNLTKGKRKGKIIKDTTTTETNKKLNEL